MQKITSCFSAILLVIALFACPLITSAQSRTYTTTGSFIVPAGVTSIKVEAWGAGGGGGAATGSPSGGGGGAGGAYVRNNSLAVIPGTTYTVTVGTGGTGPTTGNATAGGSSWFGSQTTLLAVGGTGGMRAATNSTSANGAIAPTSGNVGPFSYYGGSGGTGNASGGSGGGGGSSAGTESNGNAAAGMAAGVAVAGGGAGVAGSTSQSNGLSNDAVGGGGAGAKKTSTTNRSGGSGGNGAVVITWSCPTYSLSNTTSEGPVCVNTPASIRITSSAANLPIGIYTVTYNLSAPNTASNKTATMTVSSAGTGIFATANLATAGNTTITITNLSSGTGTSVCSSAINANASATITVNPAASQPSVITGTTSFCAGSTYIYSVIDVPGVSYNWTFPSGWSILSGANTNAVTVTTSTTAGNIVVSAQNTCGNSITRTLSVIRLTPTITSTTPATRTDFGPLTLSATASAGSVLWYPTAFGGVPLHTGTTYTTPDLVSTTTFYVEAYAGGCYSSSRVAVVATISAPEISVSGNGFNIVDEDSTPETTDYTNLGTSNVSIPLTRTYTIQNIGSVNLTIGGFDITGPHANNFAVWTTPASTVVPGGSTTFSIRFTPTAIGVRNAEISFITNDADENPFNFSIRGIGGTGVSPEIQVRGGATPIEIIDGDSGPTIDDYTDFGSATIPASITRTFTILNQGTGPLTLSGNPLVLVTGSPDFTVVTLPASTIAAGASSTFQIKYQPATTGTAIALVTIYNNDGDESVYDFVIQGAAIVTGREIDIQGNEVSIADGDTTPNIIDQTDFGVTDTSTSISIPFNVYSFGTSSLSFSPATVGISGTNASNFTATNLPSSLSSGTVGTFVVTFTPTTVGTKTATITVNSNDPDEGVYTFVVSATVQNPTPLTTGPGGVTGSLKFWLKADSNIASVNDNTAISSWNDQTTGSTKSALSKFAKEPRFKNNAADNINFNPTVYFNGSNTMSGLQGFYNQEMFIVVRPTATITSATNAQDIYCGDDVTVNKNSQDVTGFQMGNTSSRHNNEILAYNQGANTAYGIAEINTTKSYSTVNIFNPRKSSTGRMEILCNGSKLATNEVSNSTYKDINNSRYWLGRSEFFDASFEGDILEIINYSTKNTDNERAKIETYLAIKYGITLGVSGISQNYIDSSGNIIYVSATGFNYNIAGIGRDDQSNLNQKQSKTEVTSNDVTIGLESIYETNSANPNAFEGDKRFLVWGSNNGTLGAQIPVEVNMSAEIPGLTTLVTFTSIGRTWKVEETGGDIPTVKVSIPSTLLTSTITPPGDFLMFISDSPIFSPTAEYRIMKFNGSNLETSYDFDGTTYITFGYAPERTYVRSIYFDGVNDYLDAGNVLNLENKFTVSAWIKRNTANKTILSKRNAAFSTGYDLHINAAGKAEMSWINGSLQSITSSVAIPVGKWHNITVTYDGQVARLYIDGVLDAGSTVELQAVLGNSESFLVAGADGRTPTSFFNGNIDEVRVWSMALSESEIRFVMNQELLQHPDFTTTGSILPQNISLNEVSDIPWNKLKAYYPMSTYTYTNAKDESENDYTASVKNLTTVDRQTAPLPYVTVADGPWTTPSVWANSDVQNLPYSVSIIDATLLPETSRRWVSGNIVQTKHDLTSNTNKVVLALDMQSGKIDVNDSKMEVSHYLKLNGTIDLKDRSQLVQTFKSDLDPTSSGKIERDQQGQVNVYNYNYWSSPVGAMNTTSNNNNYTISSVLKDGTDPNDIKDINWTSSWDALGGSPLTLSSAWIFKFQNIAPEYANWTFIGSGGNLRAGEGFTMKGSGASSLLQNYTFTGKPNNGLITLSVGAGFLNLCGNPYPSALDGYAFIDANLGSTNGTLYFWEHFDTNQTHNLADYQGGYATLTKVGGTPPIAPALISGLGSSTRIPKRFIPVGQGFFVTGSETGGDIVFNNNQRGFVRENHTLSNVMFRNSQAPQSNASPVGDYGSNADDNVEESSFMKLRLGFTCANNYHRQILMGFMNQYATSGIDAGFDAELFDDFPNDIYFMNGTSKLVIQGEGYFDAGAIYPLGIKTSSTGNIQIMLDDLENFGSGQDFYIYDAETEIYHEISNGSVFTIEVAAGVWNERFSLRFQNNILGTGNFENSKELELAYSSTNGQLSIRYMSPTTEMKSATIYNVLGQSLTHVPFTNNEQVQRLPVGNLSSGTYIVKIATTSGTISRKFIVR